MWCSLRFMGARGEDGRIQAVLDLAGMAYTGSNHIASAAAMDKDLSKRLFRSVEVPTADWLMAPRDGRCSREEAGVACHRQAQQAGLNRGTDYCSRTGLGCKRLSMAPCGSTTR